jgi:hypothetical protein
MNTCLSGSLFIALACQYSIHVEHYVKTAANQWLLSEYDNPTITLTLNTVEAQIEIAALYENIDVDT